MKQAALCALLCSVSGCVIQNNDYSPPVDVPSAEVRIESTNPRGWVRLYTFDLTSGCQGRKEIALFLPDTGPVSTSIATGDERAIMLKFLHTAYPVEVTSEAIFKFTPVEAKNYFLNIQTIGTRVGWELSIDEANGERFAVPTTQYRANYSWSESGSYCNENIVLTDQ